VDARTAPAMENPHRVKASKFYDTENAKVVHITQEPGEALKKHKTPVDVFFYVLEGRGVVEIGVEKQKVGEDTNVLPSRWRSTKLCFFYYRNNLNVINIYRSFKTRKG